MIEDNNHSSNIRRICVITGTRAEYGILKPVMEAISHDRALKLLIVVSGMHLSLRHGFTLEEIENDGFKISSKVRMTPRGNQGYSMSEALGRGIIGFTKVFRVLAPSIIVVLGDRDEALAASLAALHMNLPIAHIHGGDSARGGIDESIRHAITKIANIHFAATERSAIRIRKLGMSEVRL